MSHLLLAVLLLACGPKPASELTTGPQDEAGTAAAAQDQIAESRPQTPQAPLPYPTRELKWGAPDGTTLAGTLSLPEGAGPHPALVLLTGSGAQDRDESLAGHRPFAVWADYLARHGVATLRMDDRGVGGSQGTLAHATLAMLAGDAGSALELLKAQEGIDPGRLGLLGHSEGATVAGRTAQAHPEVVALVLVAPPAVNGRALLVAQASAILQAAGVPQPAITAHAKAHEDAIDAIGDPEREREAFRNLVRVQVELAMTHLGAPAPPDPEALVTQAMAQVDSPMFRSMLEDEPAQTLAVLKVPILAVGGSLDLQVLPRQNLDTLSRSFEAHPDATVLEFPGLNHLMQHAGRGTPEEYALIPETVAPEVLDAVVAWLGPRLAR